MKSDDSSTGDRAVRRRPPEASKPEEEPRKVIKTGAEIVWECLERLGVKCVFGYPGGAIPHVRRDDALSRASRSGSP